MTGQRFGARHFLQNLTIVQTVYLTSKSIDYNYLIHIENTTSRNYKYKIVHRRL